MKKCLESQIQAALLRLENRLLPSEVGFTELCHEIIQEYRDDAVFRIRFLSAFKNGLINQNAGDRAMLPLQNLVYLLGSLYERNWIFPQLFSFHIFANLTGSNLVEIGGFSDAKLLKLFGVKSYIGTGLDESVMRRELKEQLDPHYYFKILDIQDSSSVTTLAGANRIFSTACFEHIFDLEKALSNCFDICSQDAFLYSYIAPVYSCIDGGQHGYTNKNKLAFSTGADKAGFHLLPIREQIAILKDKGLCMQDIYGILAELHFNNDINQRGLEYYHRVLTESTFTCARLDYIENLNISKSFPDVINHIVKKSAIDFNLSVIGIRTLLAKGLRPSYLITP